MIGDRSHGLGLLLGAILLAALVLYAGAAAWCAGILL